MRRLFSILKLIKLLNISKLRYGTRDHHLPHLSSKFYCQKSKQRKYITSQTAPVFGPWTYYETLWPFCTRIYIFSTVFLESKKVSKYENIMLCTRIYVEPTENLVVQEKKMIIVSNGQNCWSCYLSLVFRILCSPLPPIHNALID